MYGVPSKMPIEEDVPRQPINPYGISKLFFENALEAYERAYSLRSVRLRYFNAAGADESGEIGELHDPETHLIPLALAAAAGMGRELQVFGTDYSTTDGTCVRDYVHVSDLAEAHALALQHLMNGGEPLALNLGTGKGYSIRQALAAVQEVTGKAVPWRVGPRRYGDPPVLIADPSSCSGIASMEGLTSVPRHRIFGLEMDAAKSCSRWTLFKIADHQLASGRKGESMSPEERRHDCCTWRFVTSPWSTVSPGCGPPGPVPSPELSSGALPYLRACRHAGVAPWTRPVPWPTGEVHAGALPGMFARLAKRSAQAR